MRTPYTQHPSARKHTEQSPLPRRRRGGWRTVRPDLPVVRADTYRLLTRGDVRKRYQGDHGAHASLVQQLAARGWTAEDIERELLEHEGGNYLRERYAREGTRFSHYIVRYTDRQRAKPASRRPIRDLSDVIPIVEALRASAERVITGRTRATDLAMIDAWAEAALRHRTITPMLSRRDLGLAIGSPSHKTIEASLDRLMNRWELLERAPIEGGARAHAYRPTTSAIRGADLSAKGRPCGAASAPLMAQPQVRGGIGRVSPGDDCWRHRDLGRSARLIYGALDDLPVTVADLVAAGIVKSRTAYRCLAAMVKRGLALRTADGWVRGSTTPAEAGAAGKCAGHGVRDRARVAEERRVYLEGRGVLLDLTRVSDGVWVTPEGEKVTAPDLWGVDWRRVKIDDDDRERHRVWAQAQRIRPRFTALAA